MGVDGTADTLNFYTGKSGGKRYIDIRKGGNCVTGNYKVKGCVECDI